MKNAEHGSLRTYSIGFALSIFLTLIPYFIVVNHVFSGTSLGIFLVFFACLQFLVQLVFFLHLGQESKPRWKGLMFLFMLFTLLVLVIGSLWIMQNLDYNMMSPHDTNEFIQEKEQIYR